LGWPVVCVVLVLPLAAILHHAVFYRPTCMMNPFGGIDYTLNAVRQWLSRDPSLYLAGFMSVVIYQIGLRMRAIRVPIGVFIVSFFPLTLWIWDIPFTGSAICHAFHDERVFFASGMPLKSRHFYLLGVTLFALLSLLYTTRRSFGRDSSIDAADGE
jgi:hypothetical protein